MKKHVVSFSDGLSVREYYLTRIRYPEELQDKKCGGCFRFMKREGKKEGHHCTRQPYWKDVYADDRACIDYLDREEMEQARRLKEQEVENRRKELWAVYAQKEPVKLPIESDGCGRIPICPVCGEMPYSTDQCYWCGQRFIQDDEIKEYLKPKTEVIECPNCGTEGVAMISKYNGHRRFFCEKCGAAFME